jgi:hypothetical protein
MFLSQQSFLLWEISQYSILKIENTVYSPWQLSGFWQLSVFWLLASVVGRHRPPQQWHPRQCQQQPRKYREEKNQIG